MMTYCVNNTLNMDCVSLVLQVDLCVFFCAQPFLGLQLHKRGLVV